MTLGTMGVYGGGRNFCCFAPILLSLRVVTYYRTWSVSLPERTPLTLLPLPRLCPGHRRGCAISHAAAFPAQPTHTHTGGKRVGVPEVPSPPPHPCPSSVCFRGKRAFLLLVVFLVSGAGNTLFAYETCPVPAPEPQRFLAYSECKATPTPCLPGGQWEKQGLGQNRPPRRNIGRYTRAKRSALAVP